MYGINCFLRMRRRVYSQTINNILFVSLLTQNRSNTIKFDGKNL